MTFLPSLFEPRSRLSSFFPSLRRERYGDVEDVMENLWSQFPVPAYTIGVNGKRFPIDIEEQNDKYVIQAEMPGISKENIDITLKDKVLIVRYEQGEEKEEKGKSYLCRECWKGSSSRSVMLPHAKGEQDVEATLRDGVLKIEVKKEPAEVSKRIAIH
ncbi:Hsp20/alpha crystallin family protein [bacterium]|jgi:HSP20 family protein|nr:Hsp20/alpha crystallin family protein [bacterium]